RVSAGVEDRQARAVTSRFPREREAVELSGHDDVGEEKIDSPARIRDEGQRLAGVRRRQHLVSEIEQKLDGQLADEFFVLDDENRGTRSHVPQGPPARSAAT